MDRCIYWESLNWNTIREQSNKLTFVRRVVTAVERVSENEIFVMFVHVVGVYFLVTSVFAIVFAKNIATNWINLSADGL